MYLNNIGFVDEVNDEIYVVFEEYVKLNYSQVFHASSQLSTSSNASTSSISSQHLHDLYRPQKRQFLDLDTRCECDLFLNKGGGDDSKYELNKCLGEEKEKYEDVFDILKF